MGSDFIFHFPSIYMDHGIRDQGANAENVWYETPLCDGFPRVVFLSLVRTRPGIQIYGASLRSGTQWRTRSRDMSADTRS